MGCPIDWVHGGDHFWYSDRLVNSAISGSNRADRPRIMGSLVSFLYKYCFLPKGEKIGPRRPNEPLAGHGASGTNFFDRQCLCASLTQTLKNEELMRLIGAPGTNFFSLGQKTVFVKGGD